MNRPTNQNVLVVSQRLNFRLNRSGAELKAESKVRCRPIPRHYHFDRPFLVYLETRRDHQPILALWVDNAELLDQF